MIKTVYFSDFLTIEFNQSLSLFVQKWHPEKRLNQVYFQQEMLAYTNCYEKYAPENTLWLQEGFSLELGPEDYYWVEQNVNVPCLNFGNKKCAFVVGDQIKEDTSVIQVFDEPISCITPRYFPTYEAAMKWITKEDFIEEQPVISEELKMRLTKTENGLSTFEITTPTKNIKETVLLLNSLLKKEKFRKRNFKIYDGLTKKEQEILRMLAQKITVIDISEKTNTSIFTVRAHVRNIKVKLDIHRQSELVSFGLMFL